MNAQNAAQFLPLVQALADGKTIQQRSLDDGWHDLHDVHFGNDFSAYRVKPEPREWDMWVSPRGELTQNSDMLTRESIRVREILD